MAYPGAPVKIVRQKKWTCVDGVRRIVQIGSMLTPQERVLLAAKTRLSVRTIERVYAGSDTKVQTLVRIAASAKKLGLALPPAAKVLRD